MTRDQIEDERRKNRLAGIAALAGVVLFVAAGAVGGKFNGANSAEQLRLIHEGESNLLLQSLLQMFAVLLFTPAVLALFRSIRARGGGVRPGLIGLVVASPILLAASFLLVSFAYQAASDAFFTPLLDPNAPAGGPFGVAGKAVAETGFNTLTSLNQHADDVFYDQFPTQLRTGLGLAGALGLAFVMAYLALHAMRIGLLTRFWGSLGLALGIGSLLFGSPMLLAYMLMLGLLLGGFWPGRRPPAWDAGEAMPWPSPGQAQAEPPPEEETARPEDFDGAGTEVEPSRPGRRDNRRKRKRKQRS